MINLLVSLAAGAVVAVAILLGSGFGWAAAALPGAVAAVAAYAILSRRTFKQLEALFEEAQKEIMAQKFERAIRTLEGGFALAPWQFLIRAQIHSQIGVLQYVRQEFDAALPHLEKSFSRHWLARAMLATSRYRKRDLDGAVKVFEAAARANKKEGLLWAVYAWCLDKEDRHDEAVAVMGRAAKANPSDEKVKAVLQSLQNDRKLKLGKVYEEQWFQFHLERMPEAMGPRGGRRVVFQRR
ncbi:MAG TPA: tetratricopeptide repeat protein [Anaeromyxobacteraceae bacterium]|nr:tetratricopeptide repeat protein [Anaeromyxobacteraceae bacterium]